jgi:hypothetical protein
MGCNQSKQQNQISPQSSTRDLLDGDLLERVDYALIVNLRMNRPNLRIQIPHSFYHQNDLTIHSLSNYNSSYSSLVRY